MISTGAVSSVLPVSDGVLFSATGGFSPEDVGFSSAAYKGGKNQKDNNDRNDPFCLAALFFAALWAYRRLLGNFTLTEFTFLCFWCFHRFPLLFDMKYIMLHL